MKNYLKTIPILAVIMSLLSFQPAFAGGGTSHVYNIVLTPQTTSAPADGNGSITILAHTYSYICSNRDSYGGYDEYQNAGDCVAAGFGTGTIENRQVTFYLAPSRKGIIANSSDPWSYTTDSSGNATIIVKAISAGSATLSGYNEASLINMWGQTTVNFTAVPPAPTPSPSSTSAPKTQPKTGTATTTPSPTSAQAASPSPSPSPTKQVTAKTGSPATATASSNQSVLVMAMTSTGGLTAGGVVLLGLLVFLLGKLKLIKLPFVK